MLSELLLRYRVPVSNCKRFYVCVSNGKISRFRGIALNVAGKSEGRIEMKLTVFFFFFQREKKNGIRLQKNIVRTGFVVFLSVLLFFRVFFFCVYISLLPPLCYLSSIGHADSTNSFRKRREKKDRISSKEPFSTCIALPFFHFISFEIVHSYFFVK